MLQLEKLAIGYTKRCVLRDIDCTIERGTLTALIGVNGSGKSTLLRSMAGLIEPLAGELKIAGRSITDYSRREMARTVAIVQQHPTTTFDFTAYELVMMARYPYRGRMEGESRADRMAVEQALQATGAEHLAQRCMSQMSGGEQQRVMIARALAQQTPLLLLDEPLTGLDIAHQIEVIRLLQQLNDEEGKTIIVALHDIGMVYRYCRRVMIINDGRIAYHGETHNEMTTERIRQVFGVETKIVDGEMIIT